MSGADHTRASSHVTKPNLRYRVTSKSTRLEVNGYLLAQPNTILWKPAADTQET